MMENDILLDIDDVFYFYNVFNSKPVVPVIRGFSLKVYTQEIVGILGPSGSGKTTLLKLILQQITPLTGRITFNFEKIQSQIGYMPQNPKDLVINELQVGEWIELLRRKNSKVDEAFNEFIEDALINLNFKKFKNQEIIDLSGGQIQRLAFISSLLKKPKLLLLDEPTSMLGSQYGDQMISILKKYVSHFKASCILVTHSFKTAKECSRIYEVFAGTNRLAGIFDETTYINQSLGPYSLYIDKWGRVLLPPIVLKNLDITDLINLNFVGEKFVIGEK